MRRPRRPRQNDLAIDSLIDVFMNVLGVLMITAVVIALSVGQDGTPPAADPEPIPAPRPQPPKQVEPIPAPVRMMLPQAVDALTDPLFVLVTAEGFRPVNGNDPSTVDRYFLSDRFADSLRMEALEGMVMGGQELRDWLRRHSPAERHVMALITPDGAGNYRVVRRLAAAEGFRSGWLHHEGTTIRMGSGGRSGRTVQ